MTIDWAAMMDIPLEHLPALRIAPSLRTGPVPNLMRRPQTVPTGGARPYTYTGSFGLRPGSANAKPLPPARLRVKSSINGLKTLPSPRGRLCSSLAISPRGSYGPLKHPHAFFVGQQGVIGQGDKGFSFIARGAQVAQTSTKALRQELKAKGVALPDLAALQILAKSFHDGFEAFLVSSASRRSGTSWYTIFKEADADGSGVIQLDEFKRVTRRTIGLSQSKLSDDGLKALFCALDVDDSSGVPYDEFKHFLKLYTPKVSTGPRWVGANQELTGRGADTGFSFVSHGEVLQQTPTTTLRAQLAAKGVVLPNSERLDKLSRLFNERLEEARTKALGNQATQTNVSWFQLFNQIDKDGSGFITYDEMKEIARRRDKLRLLRSEVSDDQLQALWCALDVDNSNHLTKDEFGAFLRRSPVEHKDIKRFGVSQDNVSGKGLKGFSFIARGAEEHPPPKTARKANPVRFELPMELPPPSRSTPATPRAPRV